MEGENKKSGWKIWVYLTPLYILAAIPLIKWTQKINSGDVALSREEYGAFNSSEGEIKKSTTGYNPDLNDIGYSVRYRSAKGGGEPDSSPRSAASRDEGKSGNGSGQEAAAGKTGQRPQGQGRFASGNQAALESDQTRLKEQMSFGQQKGLLTSAVGKAMNSPKAVGALFNNSWVVKGFMSRGTVKAATGSPQGLQNYMKNTTAINNFLGNSVVQAAMNNPALVNAFAGSGMANAILNSPGVQSMLQNPESLTSLAMTNPQIFQALSNPNVMNALMNNPQTAGLAASLGGAGGKIPRK